jgi:small-conductance mechanosensitive channel
VKIRYAVVLGLAVILAMVGGFFASAMAATVTVVVRPSDDAETVARAIQAASRGGQGVVVRIEEPPPAAPPASVGETALAPSEVGPLRLALARGRRGIEAFPAVVKAATDAWNASVNARGWAALGAILAVIGGALAATLLAHRLLRRLLARHLAPSSDAFPRRLASSSVLLAADLAALAVFFAAGHIAVDLILPLADFVRTLALMAVDTLTGSALYMIAGRFVLAPGEPGRRLLPLPRAEWHYRMLVLYGFCAPLLFQTLTLGGPLALDPGALAGWLMIAGTAILALKLWWFWRGRHDVTGMLLAGGAGREPTLLSQAAAIGLPYLNIAVAILIWILVGMTATDQRGDRFAVPAGLTQILVIVLPILGAGVVRMTEAASARWLAQRSPTPRTLALVRVARTIATGAAWVIGLAIIGNLWTSYLVDTSSAAAAAMVQTFNGAALALIGGLIAWTFLRAYFDTYAPRRRAAMPGEEDEVQVRTSGRLETVLPLLRGVAFGTVASLTALVVLSRLGVEIGPLLAGFGVIGLAISFGSQALVRDIVSGIFFMTDDAFRVGEYIDTGRLRGTVEKITLRSVQLRHQNGQIHTVPFGQLQSTTNFSRDWATIKFSLRLDRDADIEQARKRVKRVGEQMMTDPELGPEFILPLKMQGVQEITDTAIVIRLKFTCRPSKPTWLQREALKRVYREFQAAGVPLASNAVTVKGGGSPESAAAGINAAAPAAPAVPAAAS